MHSRMEEYANRQSAGTNENNYAPAPNTSAQKQQASDYIDFEEVK